MAEACVFGEVLFDCFPGGEKVLGGAPFNVAWHLQAFGEAPRFFSRVGGDAEGLAILHAMRAWGMRCDGMQRDAQLPTGRVNIHFDNNGEPHYDIVHPAAWDAIEAVDTADCAMLYHGSLALREAASRHALQQLKSGSRARVFVDINLRPPWCGSDAVHEALHGADWVKLNADEFGLLGDASEPAAWVAAHGLSGLILTRGADGAEIYTQGCDPIVVQPEHGLPMVDTVGAGDAFASVMLLGLLRGWPLAVTARRAQDFASRMVAQRGATVHDAGFYRQVMADWGEEDNEEDAADV